MVTIQKWFGSVEEFLEPLIYRLYPDEGKTVEQTFKSNNGRVIGWLNQSYGSDNIKKFIALSDKIGFEELIELLANDKKKSVPKIDLSKFSWGKGYTLYIQNFGVLDPLFGDYESDNWWLSDEEFVKFVINKYGLQDKFIEFMKDEYDADAFSLYDNVTLDLVLDSIYEINAEEMIISRFLREVAEVVDDEALVGFTDKKDVIELVKYFGIEDDSDVSIVELDTKVV